MKPNPSPSHPDPSRSDDDADAALFAEVLAFDALVAERQAELDALEEERKQKGFLGRMGVDRRIKAITMPDEAERTQALVQAGWRVLGSDLAERAGDEALSALMTELQPIRESGAALAQELEEHGAEAARLEAEWEELRGEATTREAALAHGAAVDRRARAAVDAHLRAVGEAYARPEPLTEHRVEAIDEALAELDRLAEERARHLNRVQVLKLDVQLTGLTAEKAGLRRQRDELRAALQNLDARLSVLDYNHLLLEDLMTELAPPDRPPPRLQTLGPAPRNGSTPAPTTVVRLVAESEAGASLRLELFVGDGVTLGGAEADLTIEGGDAVEPVHGALRLGPRGVCFVDWSAGAAARVSGAAVPKASWQILPLTESRLLLAEGVELTVTPIRALDTNAPPCGVVLKRPDVWYVLLKARAAVTWTPAGDLTFHAPNHPRSSFELGLDPSTNTLRVAGRPDKPVVIKQGDEPADKPVSLDHATRIEGPQGGVVRLSPPD